MKLSRLYSNTPNLFGPIDFKAGLNVVLAEIRLPENKDKDTHNLGKTTLGRMMTIASSRDAKRTSFSSSTKTSSRTLCSF